METPPQAVSRPYSIIVLSYGVLSVSGALALKSFLPEMDVEHNIWFITHVHLVFGLGALVVSLLRWTQGVHSLPASDGFSIALAFQLPLGTLVFIYWFIRIRLKERELQTGRRPVRWYTAALVIAALGCALLWVGLADLVMRLEDPNELFSFIGNAFGGLAIALLVVSALRSVKMRWGFYATFLLNIVLVALPPFGTAAAIVWFLAVRPSDKETTMIVSAGDAA